jgi:hypothetical protein
LPRPRPRVRLPQNQARRLAVSRKSRINLALVLMGSGIVFNLIILARGDESFGWPLAAVILLSGAAITLLSERRGF